MLIFFIQDKRKSSKPKKIPVQKHVSGADYIYGDDDELMQVNFDEYGGLLLPFYTISAPHYCRDGGKLTLQCFYTGNCSVIA